MPTKIDDNFEYVTMGADDVTGDPKPLLVDPITGYLLVAVTIEGSSDLNVASKIDENFEGTALATDDTTGLARPLKVNTNNKLLCDII